MSSGSVTIRVPATTANLGPGYDSLGIALQLYNTVRVARAAERTGQWRSTHEETLGVGAVRMIDEAARLFFRRARKKSFQFDLSVSGNVPTARGLGSSVTVRLGIVAGLNELTGADLTRRAMLELVNELEHHPDNAAPAIFGGFTVAGMVGRMVRCVRVPVSKRVRFITLVPDFEVSTRRARSLVPKQFSKEDTVHNLNRASMISAAFARAEYEALRGLFDDRLHQPYREELIPQLSSVIRAGEKAGAIGGWLSGSGSTIICMTIENPLAVGDAMKRRLRGAKVMVLGTDNSGFRVL